MATPSVDTFIDPEKAVLDTTIRENEFSVELTRQPGLVYYYTAQLAKAERQHSTLKLRLEATEAKVASTIRQDAQAAGEKLTADMVKERVRLHSQVMAVESLLIQAREVEATIKAVCEALRHKKDMLIIRGHMTRDEMKARLGLDEDLSAPVSDAVRTRDEEIKSRLGK